MWEQRLPLYFLLQGSTKYTVSCLNADLFFFVCQLLKPKRSRQPTPRTRRATPAHPQTANGTGTAVRTRQRNKHPGQEEEEEVIMNCLHDPLAD